MDDTDIGQTQVKYKSQRPRFDYHTKIDFDLSTEDAELTIEVWSVCRTMQSRCSVW